MENNNKLNEEFFANIQDKIKTMETKALVEWRNQIEGTKKNTPDEIEAAKRIIDMINVEVGTRKFDEIIVRGDR